MSGIWLFYLRAGRRMLNVIALKERAVSRNLLCGIYHSADVEIVPDGYRIHDLLYLVTHIC